MFSRAVHKRYFSAWLHQRLAQVPSSRNAVALIVDAREVKSNELECLSHVASSKDFRQDLDMNQFMWVYLGSNYPVQRCLLLQQKFKANKESEKDEAAVDA